MARKVIRRYLPDPAAIKEKPALQFLGDLLHDPNLFHLNRHSVSLAFFFGVFFAFLPVPGQMVLAALCALWVRCNMPITLALVWITNPLTYAPIFFATYQLGRWILDAPTLANSSEHNWAWLMEEFSLIWKPLMLGSIITGLILGGISYIAMQLFWRWHVLRAWEHRKLRRKSRDSE
ncbi:DUF2062 domain-containing protein [Gilvimarinus sp. SDUM040013]|uniref:DUF2062 domain-containing protein n=1 Tax=Gilvimarinus gilvus TaxID=3058038 RepID=A0ABU4S314_9GAMM|nr:DUF2062 domain-containing protein [Gilvimarinus sp. SDUM040013]MDO3387153.1 DUF2062 domain-containing protein [Gilvimarinus sp. SDUM040013]MDX6850896.1 DUF2062 domain-containing protein [Gilvimarinus sp. SDUM040013]